MDKYKFWVPFLLGITVWGAISVGLRYVHYAFQVDCIPKVVMAPGRTMKPIMPAGEKAVIEEQKKLQMVAAEKKAKETDWEKIKEWIGTIANIMTIIAPLTSGMLAVVIYRRQRILFPKQTPSPIEAIRPKAVVKRKEKGAVRKF
jgi:hypothetical protein